MLEKIILVALSVILTGYSYAQETYYWYKNVRQPLSVDYQKQFVVVGSHSEKETLKELLDKNDIEYEGFQKISQTGNDSNFYWTYIYLTDAKATYNNSHIVYSSPSYCDKKGRKVGISHLFYVKLKTAADTQLLFNWAEDYRVNVNESLRYSPLWYKLSCTSQSEGNSLEMANLFYESGLFSAVSPDFMVKDNVCCVNDSLFPNQWNLKNTGQYGDDFEGYDIRYCEAHQTTTGSNDVVVAVVDKGVQRDHPDLQNIYGVSYDTESGTSPSALYTSHGTLCAGIIGATTNNEFGIAGIAPSSPIMSISNRFQNIPAMSGKLADGINFAWQNGASVINCSWGFAENELIEDAISNALRYGRNGKGCVVVSSSGNFRYDHLDYVDSNITFPATLADVIAVGAMSPCGERKSRNTCDGDTDWTSCYGHNLSVVAPGTLIPTISSGNTTKIFGGTSAAAPHVAGVAALMLSVNSRLTHQQVKQIIERTARKIGNYSYQTDSTHLNGTWNEEMGYGLLDAYAAVTASIVNLYTRDNEDDNGLSYIHDMNYAPFNSPDIWVRNQADNGTVHQSALRGTTNYVNVRIHNRGGCTSSGNDSVYLYIKRAALGVDTWPTAWHPLASAAIPAIAPNGDTVVRIGATFPNGNPLSAYWNTNPYVNYAILSRIKSANGMFVVEGTNTGMNIINNNNISAKNVVVAQAFPIGDVETEVALCAVENPSDNPFVTNLRCATPQSEAGRPLWEEAEIRLILDPTLAAAWRATGGTATNLRQENDTTLLVCGAEARLTNFTVPANYEGYLVVQVNFLTQEYSEKTTYEYVISEYKPGTDSLQGSLSVVVEKPLRSYLFEAEASEDPIVTRNTTVTVSADNIGEGAVYNWYNAADSLVGTGESLSFTASATAQYKLEVVATADGYKDYDSVLVVTTLGKITSLTPNPAGGQVTVGYELSPDVTGATLVIAGAANGQTYCTSSLSAAQTSQIVSLQAVPAGLYAVRIECQGTLVDIKNLIVY